MEPGDLVGLEAAEAVARAQGAGYEVRQVATSPPWSGRGEGGPRVVRVRPVGPNCLELTVAWERWLRTGGGRP